MADIDFNVLERRAREFKAAGDVDNALRIYYFMADGDPSLDGGHLGVMIGKCYEAKGEFYAARYWYTGALEENPERDDYKEIQRSIPPISI